jgi:hypothetical protein
LTRTDVCSQIRVRTSSIAAAAVAGVDDDDAVADKVYSRQQHIA